MPSVMIVYYSRKGENYWDGGVRRLDKGNTERVAEFIQKAVGGKLFEIETVKPYAEKYETCIEEAKRELRDNARPEIKGYPRDVVESDVVFVGYPNWWGTMPTCMFTWLEKLDLSGKIVAPFCTNEGSGLGRSERDLREICAGAILKPGLSIRGCRAAESETVVADWAKKIVENYENGE